MVGDGEDNNVTHRRRADLAFGDIIGQEGLKEALLAVAANDDLDGLLIRGEKGTAKSTAVRGVADLLPQQRAVADCPYGCPPAEPERQCADCRSRSNPETTERPTPLVTLPLGATRERVVGSLSVADALDGDYEFDPGLLARANRGILYVDEVNLLDDHLVDVLLDAAASGINRVERDGVSVSHPAEFTLVGTMNPEEGDLRPQLRDRFALQATVTGCSDIDQRVAIVEQALEDTEATAAAGSDSVEHREQLAWARDNLDDVTISTTLLEDIAELCRTAGVDGHRGDIATARAARTLAALDGRRNVEAADVRRAAELALPHRLQSHPFEETPDTDELLDDHFDGEQADDSDPGKSGNEPDDADDETTGEEPDPSDETTDEESPPSSDDPSANADERTDENDPTESGDQSRGEDTDSSDPATAESHAEQHEDDGEKRTPLVPGQERADIGESAAPPVSAPETTASTDGDGTSAQAEPSVDNEGARVRSEPADTNSAIDAAASVRAAARRGGDTVGSRDLRQSVRAGETTALVVFVVDASASMRPAMRAAKGTVLELLQDAYQQRDAVAFVAFAGDDAEVLLPPTDSVSLAARHLKELPTGDRTPIPAGLDTARGVLDRADPDSSVTVLVTDGRANVADGSPTETSRAAARALAETGTRLVVVDADTDATGVTDAIVAETDAERIPLDALSADHIEETLATRSP